MRRWSRATVLSASCSGVVALALLLGGAGAPATAQPVVSIDEAGWQGVLGVRPVVSTAQRYIVVLRSPSLAARVRAEGGQATEAQMRRWTAAAVSGQEQFLRRIVASGAQVAAEHRYVRVLNAFSTRLDPTSLAVLDRDREVVGVYPVRAAFPAADEITPGLQAAVSSSVPGLGIPGLDGHGVVVALLDTGVDRSHPYLREAVLPGIDVITPGSGGIAQPHPTISGRSERHGTELAGIVAGVDGPGGLHGVAPGASILPIRVAGLAAGRGGRLRGVLADRSAAGGPRGSRRSERGRRRPRRGSDRARRPRRAVRVVPRRSSRPGHRGSDGAGHARRRSRRERRSRRADVREHRGTGRGSRRADRGRGRRPACDADGSRARPSRAARALRRDASTRRSSDRDRDRDARARDARCGLPRDPPGTSTRAARARSPVGRRCCRAAGSRTRRSRRPLLPGPERCSSTGRCPRAPSASTFRAECRSSACRSSSRDRSRPLDAERDARDRLRRRTRARR